MKLTYELRRHVDMVLVGGFFSIKPACYPSEQPSQDKPIPRFLPNDRSEESRETCVESVYAGRWIAGSIGFGRAVALVRWAMPCGDIKTGKLLWKHPLPAGPMRWGVAIDRNGRVLVSLGDGRVFCVADKG
ncbi:MAG: PQQ-binding-like beta-propeller repeat protein [Thermoguttaceae bacterium]